jgi:hypothetical protein
MAGSDCLKLLGEMDTLHVERNSVVGSSYLDIEDYAQYLMQLSVVSNLILEGVRMIT